MAEGSCSAQPPGSVSEPASVVAGARYYYVARQPRLETHGTRTERRRTLRPRPPLRRLYGKKVWWSVGEVVEVVEGVVQETIIDNINS